MNDIIICSDYVTQKEVQDMDIRETEEFIDLKRRKEKRLQRKHRKYLLSEICNSVFMVLVWAVAMTVIVPLSEAAPGKALLFYEFATAGVISVVVAFWLDKSRRKK